MQLPSVTDATEQPCPSPPAVSAPQELTGQAPCHHPRTFLLAPAGPAQQAQIVCVLGLSCPSQEGAIGRRTREGVQGGGEFLFFFFFFAHTLIRLLKSLPM